jgi:hypothetical protein
MEAEVDELRRSHPAILPAGRRHSEPDFGARATPRFIMLPNQ